MTKTTRELSKLHEAMVELEAAVSAGHASDMPEAAYQSFMHRMSVLAKVAAVEERVTQVLHEAFGALETDCAQDVRVMTDVIRSGAGGHISA
jgi:hypothetical protein